MANTQLEGGVERFTGDRDRAAEARRAGIEPGQTMPYSRAERGPAAPPRGGWSAAPAGPAGGTGRAPGRLPDAGAEEPQERRR